MGDAPCGVSSRANSSEFDRLTACGVVFEWII